MLSLEKKLKHHNLRITPIRLDILANFYDANNALSHADFEIKFAEKYDRVTIYRTLTTFLENGILHKVPDDTGIAKYAMCQHENHSHTHEDNHVHFKCSICNFTECLHTLEIPTFKLPKKYKAITANLLIEGICAKCSLI